mmetsp:Transcript_46345/g.140602  ORF Transcript_46345/g.140602 Transcript_46345/m.140602 type:complete len:205 (-) Transcript_46345:138-752(-)
MAVPLANPPPVTTLRMFKNAVLANVSAKRSRLSLSLGRGQSARSSACRSRKRRLAAGSGGGGGIASGASATQPEVTEKSGWRWRKGRSFSPQPSVLRAPLAPSPWRQENRSSKSAFDRGPRDRRIAAIWWARASSEARTQKSSALAAPTPHLASVSPSSRSLSPKDRVCSTKGICSKAQTFSLMLATVSTELAVTVTAPEWQTS